MTRGGGGRSSTATVLFTDLVASTELRRTLGDDRADDLRRRHDEAVAAAARDHQGETVKGTGDGLMLVFPAAAEGVAGAVAIQRAVGRLAREAGVTLAVRVGLSSGDVSWEGEDCFGTPVVEAARLCGAANEGQVLVTEIVRLLAGSRGGHRLDPVGIRLLKGLGEVAAFEVAWEPEPDATVPLPTPLTGGETLPLIGRVEEREALATAWKRTLAGDPQVVLVAGEPGVGKTRLAADLARSVHGDGAAVLFGRCDEELGVPYQPFVEATATYAAGCSDDVLAVTLGGAAADLARLVPALGARVALPELVRADPETERYRLFDAFTAFVASVASQQPTLLVLDDVHWAAKPTLLMLRHLIRHRSGRPLMVVATYRDTDLGRGHPLSETLADLRRDEGVERILLRGLGEAEVVELISSAAGHELDGAALRLAHEVHAETEGNPFFVGQVLRHLVEIEALRVEDGRWVVSDRRQVGIPEGVREVIGKRLSQLAAATNEVLSVAAVIGREFDGPLLIEACGLDADDVLDALEEAEASRLVTSLTARDDRRTFAHALVRSTLYEEIPTTRRLRIHRRIAQALEARAARGVPCLEELAHHTREAASLGDVQAALRWSRAAAQAASDRLAYEEAADQYGRALDVLDPDDPGHAAERAALLVQRARALRAAGLVAHSRDASLGAIVEAREAGRADLLLEAALAMGGDRGWSEAGVVDHELIGILEEGLAALPPGDSRVRAMASARLGGELYFVLEEERRRRRLTDEAVAMAGRLDDDDARAFVLSCAVWGAWVPENPAERLAQAHEIIELGRRSGNVMHELTGCMWVVSCCAELGDGEGFRAYLARALEVAEQVRRPEWRWVTLVHRGAEALMEARFDDAQAHIDEALAIGQQLGGETVMQLYGVGVFALARARGGLDQLVPLVQSLVEQFPLLPAWRCGLAFLYRDLGMREEAREHFEIFARDDFRTIPRDANWKVGIGILASVCAMVGDRPRAEVLYDLLLPVADTMIIVGMPADVLGSVHLPLALLAATLDRWDDAEAHVAAALEADERCGCRAWSIYTRVEWARLLAARGSPGDAERVRALIETCRSDAVGAGMARIVAACDGLLAEVGAGG